MQGSWIEVFHDPSLCCWRAEKGRYATSLGIQAVGPNVQLAISAEGPQPVRDPACGASLLACQSRFAPSLSCFQLAQQHAEAPKRSALPSERCVHAADLLC